jgi:hypothetical protein
MSFREVLDTVLKVTGRKRLLVPLPFPWRASSAIAGCNCRRRR